MKNRKGLFITLEGVDGVGKTTTLRYLKHLASEYASDRPVLFTKEPAGTPFGSRIRNLLLDTNFHVDKLTQAYLFAAARRDHVEYVIKPALKRGKMVICDRYLLSSLAYQGRYVPGQDIKHNLRDNLYSLVHAHHLVHGRHYTDENYVAELNREACDGIYPDLLVYFNLSKKLVRKRLAERKNTKYDRYDSKLANAKYMNRLRHQYWVALWKSTAKKLIVNSALSPRKRARIIWKNIKRLAECKEGE